MGIEAGSNIAALDSSWPLSGDNLNEGDNHLRLLKAVLKAQFPGVGGQGFAVPITAEETEINFLGGVTSNIQDQIDALSDVSGVEIPPGTRMLFYQAAAPVGWTQISNDDNSMLRMVSGVGGGSGGDDSPIELTYADHVHATSIHTLTLAEIPSHDHNLGGRAVVVTNSTNISPTDPESGSSPSGRTFTATSEGGGGGHSHGDTLSASGFTFTPRYINVIQASKDA